MGFLENDLSLPFVTLCNSLLIPVATPVSRGWHRSSTQSHTWIHRVVLSHKKNAQPTQAFRHLHTSYDTHWERCHYQPAGAYLGMERVITLRHTRSETYTHAHTVANNISMLQRSYFASLSVCLCYTHKHKKQTAPMNTFIFIKVSGQE